MSVPVIQFPKTQAGRKFMGAYLRHSRATDFTRGMSLDGIDWDVEADLAIRAAQGAVDDDPDDGDAA